jgi:putative hydrolase of the HAD superfamily
MVAVNIRAVLFDIGGVLEITPATHWQEKWCERFDIDLSEMRRRVGGIWEAGETGALSIGEVENRTAIELELDETYLRALMDDIWGEYLGTLNEDMALFFDSLHNQFRTGILSNSFVGAR